MSDHLLPLFSHHIWEHLCCSNLTSELMLRWLVLRQIKALIHPTYFWFCLFLESSSKALLSIREKLKLFANVPSGQYFLFLAWVESTHPPPASPLLASRWTLLLLLLLLLLVFLLTVLHFCPCHSRVTVQRSFLSLPTEFIYSLQS